MAKKPAIQARQGHPTGIIDDAGKAIGKTMKKTKSAGEFVSDVASDRYARARYYTIPKAVDKMAGRTARSAKQPSKKVKLDAGVIKDITKGKKTWMMPNGDELPKRKAQKAMRKYGPK